MKGNDNNFLGTPRDSSHHQRCPVLDPSDATMSLGLFLVGFLFPLLGWLGWGAGPGTLLVCSCHWTRSRVSPCRRISASFLLYFVAPAMCSAPRNIRSSSPGTSGSQSG